MCSALLRAGNARNCQGQQVNQSSPKAEVTGSNPVGCASLLNSLGDTCRTHERTCGAEESVTLLPSTPSAAAIGTARANILVAVCACIAVPMGAITTSAGEPFEAHYRFLGDFPSQLQGPWTEECQGIAHDDTHWYLIQVDGVWRVPRTMNLNSINTNDPSVSYRSSTNMGDISGVDHVGDGEVFRDPNSGLAYLVIAIEGPNGLVFLRADSSMAYVKHVLWQDVSPQQTHSSWAATDSQGNIYSSNFDNIDLVFRYSINWASLEQAGPVDIQPDGALMLGSNADKVQGGVFSTSGDRLYLVADAIKVYDTQTGALVQQSTNGSGLFNFEFHDSFPNSEEPEGVTIWDLDGAGVPGIEGQLHVVLLDNDAPDGDDVYLKHYSGALYVNHAAPPPGNGRYSSPYTTLTQAVNAAWAGVRIKVAGGSYPGAITLSTPIRISSTGGTAVIGH